MKLWEKGYILDSRIEAFMTADDPLLDEALISYDCIGSIAHAKMLEKIGILTAQECDLLIQKLQHLSSLAEADKFQIPFEEEDVHTAIENALIRELGEIGKKLHTARSRNDQILLDLRLYAREWILQIVQEVLTTCDTLLSFAKKHHAVPIPGRTHFQRAMPSSLGLWAAAFAESLLDDIEILQSAYLLVDQCPLGSAASFGVSLPIDRQFVSELLGFKALQNNVLYANNSRGKFEAVVLHALVQIMNDLAKLSTDIILFSAPEFGYFILPEKFCPGSSLMPQKRNPCPLELIRAKSATLQGYLFQVLEIIRSLPSGYNRDVQETKRPFMKGFELTLLSLKILSQIMTELQVQKEKCLEAFSPELFATDQVLKLVKEGIPFRAAYVEIAKHPGKVVMQDPVDNILAKTHLGATGNLGLEKNWTRLQTYKNWKQVLQKKWEDVKTKLLT